MRDYASYASWDKAVSLAAGALQTCAAPVNHLWWLCQGTQGSFIPAQEIPSRGHGLIVHLCWHQLLLLLRMLIHWPS